MHSFYGFINFLLLFSFLFFLWVLARADLEAILQRDGTNANAQSGLDRIKRGLAAIAKDEEGMAYFVLYFLYYYFLSHTYKQNSN